MKKSPAAININLLPKDPFFETAIGRFLQWALSAGRYIVIFTELIVIISFAARFTLDRKLTDVNSEINTKKNLIESYGDLEDRFRLVQSRLDSVKQMNQDLNIQDVFDSLTKVTPPDVLLTQLSISPTTVSITGSTPSQESFNLLINNLQFSGKFFNINVSKVESGKDKTPGFNFVITAETKEVKKDTTNTAKPDDKVNILDRTGGV